MASNISKLSKIENQPFQCEPSYLYQCLCFQKSNGLTGRQIEDEFLEMEKWLSNLEDESWKWIYENCTILYRISPSYSNTNSIGHLMTDRIGFRNKEDLLAFKLRFDI